MLRRLATVPLLALALAAPAQAATPPNLTEVVTTQHFVVHFTSVAGSPDAITTSAAATLGANAETAYGTYASWGYPPPLDDGDGRVDIDVWYFDSTNAAGVAWWSAPPGFTATRFPGRIAIKPPYVGLTSVVAHELFHVVQFAMDVRAPFWLDEAGARWAEHTGPWHDGWAGLPDKSYLSHPDMSIDCVAAGCPAGTWDLGYERWLFWSFLSNRYGNGFQHEVYDALKAPSFIPTLAPTLWQSFDNVLAGHGTSLARTWNEFAVANAARSYPALATGTQIVATQRVTVGASVGATVSHLAARYVELLPSSSTCSSTTLHVHVGGSGAGVPTVVVGSAITATANGTADVAWATCGPHPIVVLPNDSPTLDGQQFTVDSSIDGTTPAKPSTGPAADTAPTLSLLGVGAVLKLSAAKPVLALDLSCNAPGRVEIALASGVVATLDVRPGTNTIRVRLPKMRKGAKAAVVLTSLSPGGTRGNPVRVNVVFV